ncbi:MAG: TIGR00282 family metallophosphoesterase [Patescibacteria group bacterium]|nr:TIGR00282 family metallophosphoesterase [Patescibacteria group bacterium]
MPDKTIKIIFLGDISGYLGREGVKAIVPIWQKKYQPDLFIANIENLAHNKGVTPKTLKEIYDTGVRLYSGGNHIWKKYDISQLAKESDYQIACPANDSRTPKKYRYQTTEVKGAKIALVSLNGRTFMNDDGLANPFFTIEKILSELPPDAITIVDIHAEATSEKRALGFYLDGRVAAVLGTHTHVPTADAQILAKGTAYLTDIGMIGAHDSILGIKKEIIIEKFLTENKILHDLPKSGQIEINAVLLEIDKLSKKAKKIKNLREIIN